MLNRLAAFFLIPAFAIFATEAEEVTFDTMDLIEAEEVTFDTTDIVELEEITFDALDETEAVEVQSLLDVDDPVKAWADAIRNLGLADGEQPDEEILCDFFIMAWDHLDEIKARFPRISDIFKFSKENVELFTQMGFNLDDDNLEMLDELISYFEERERIYEEGKAPAIAN